MRFMVFVAAAVAAAFSTAPAKAAIIGYQIETIATVQFGTNGTDGSVRGALSVLAVGDTDQAVTLTGGNSGFPYSVPVTVTLQLGGTTYTVTDLAYVSPLSVYVGSGVYLGFDETFDNGFAMTAPSLTNYDALSPTGWTMVTPGFVLGNFMTDKGYLIVTSFANTYFQAAAIPEPATWALMLIGFGLVGCNARGRRKAIRSHGRAGTGTSRGSAL